MSRACIFYADEFLRHGHDSHLEGPGRLSRTMQHLKDVGALDRIDVLRPRKASDEELCAVHLPHYVQYIKSFPGGMLDPDTIMTAGSLEAALMAAGAAIGCVDQAEQRELSFGLVRPPGHHAMPGNAMGFCLFNNAAVGAAYALKARRRVLIVDWDVHHGNGTEHMFYSSPKVLYFSVHQYPFYPGTGDFHDVGSGDGEGYNVNVPLPAGSTDRDFLEAFGRVLLPIAADYRPELIIVSAGFDPHHADQLGGMQVTERGFQAMALAVRTMARGQGVAALLEGGYSEALPRCVETSIKGFLGEEAVVTGETTGAALANIEKAVSVQKSYWRL